MSEAVKEVLGNEMINKVVFERVWKQFTEEFGSSDGDLIHGYMILKAICAILEDAFNIEPPAVVVDNTEEEDGTV